MSSNQKTKFTRVGESNTRLVEAGAFTDWLARTLGHAGPVTVDALKSQGKNLPHDFGELNKYIFQGLAHVPRAEDFMNRAIAPMKDLGDQSFGKATRKLPQVLDPRQGTILSKFFPKLRLFTGSLQTPVEGLVIVTRDASGKILNERPANMSMGELLQMLDKHPEYFDPKNLKSPYALDSVNGAAKLDESIDNFCNAAVKDYKNSAGARAKKSIIKGSRVIAILATLIGAKVAYDTFAPQNPANIPGNQQKVDKGIDFLNVPTETDQNKIFTNSGYGGTASGTNGYGNGLGNLGPSVNPQPNNPNNPDWMNTDYSWMKNSSRLEKTTLAQINSQLPTPPNLPTVDEIIASLNNVVATSGGNEQHAQDLALRQMLEWRVAAENYIQAMQSAFPGLQVPKIGVIDNG